MRVDHLDRELASRVRTLERTRVAQDRRRRDRELGDLLGALAQRRVERAAQLVADDDHGHDREHDDRGENRDRGRGREPDAQGARIPHARSTNPEPRSVRINGGSPSLRRSRVT